MKILSSLLCLFITCLFFSKAQAQFQQIGVTGYWETPAVNGNWIGIGNFGASTTNLLSSLHVDAASLSTTTGEVFRTNAPNGAATYWRMCRGGNSNYFGNIYNNNDNHFYIQAANANGNLYFQSGGNNTRMTILGTTNPGYVGINTSTPNRLLQVNQSTTGGIINCTGPGTSPDGSGYQINDQYMLWHNGYTDNLYIGINSGNSTGTGLQNSFVGNSTGLSLTGGRYNSFFGWHAGAANTSGESNTFIGNEAGAANTTTGGNTFVGHQSGIAQITGGENTFIGSLSGYTSNGGSANTFIGQAAGHNMLNRSNCTFVGIASGYNTLEVGNSFFGSISGNSTTSGMYNTFIGMSAGQGNTDGSYNSSLGYNAGTTGFTLLGSFNTFLGCSAIYQAGANRDNVTAVGANTIVPGSNQLILGGNTLPSGDNDVNVGIGLSGDNMAANGLGYEGPAVKLEINADASNFSYTGVGSGLRFRQLTIANTPGPNPGLGVLAVDGEGDVIYVEEIGNYCGASVQRPLNGDYEISLDGVGAFDYHFTGQKDNAACVLVGTSCGNPAPFAKFQSYQSVTQTNLLNAESDAGRFYNSTNNRHAIGGIGISDFSEYSNFGLKGYARLDVGNSNYGVFGTTIEYPVILAGNINVGVYGYSPTSNQHSGATIRYGVIGDLGIAGPCAPLPCPMTAPDYAGYFNGDLVSTSAIYIVSDLNLKFNVQDLTNAIDVINQLNPKTFEYKNEQYESMQLPHGSHFGFISQEVEALLPQIVKESIHPERIDSMGIQTHAAIDFKALNYIELIPILVGAIKEQQQAMEAMQAEIAILNGGGNRHGNHGSGKEGEYEGNKGIDVKLTNSMAIILDQNVPNPFAEQTTISYFITEDVKKAQVFFYDNKGIILKIVDLYEKGAGQLNVFAADLSSGIYTYSLIADGKVIESKKMVKQ